MPILSKEAIILIKEYARENMRIATDSIRHDPLLHGGYRTEENVRKSSELQDDGLAASSRYHAAKDILELCGVNAEDL